MFMRHFWLVGIAIAFVAGAAWSQTTAPAATPKAWKCGPPNHPPVVNKAPEAKMPKSARKKKLNGVCMVAATVGTDGDTHEVRILGCTSPIFAQTSLNAVSQYSFKPATDEHRHPLSCPITVEVNYRLWPGHNPTPIIFYKLSSPPEFASSAPNAKGVYPLIATMEQPELKKFADEKYSVHAMISSDKSPCDVELTLSRKGKVSNVTVLHCEQKDIQKPLTKSLRKSRFKPARLNGKKVAVRLKMHLEFEGFKPKK